MSQEIVQVLLEQRRVRWNEGNNFDLGTADTLIKASTTSSSRRWR